MSRKIESLLALIIMMVLALTAQSQISSAEEAQKAQSFFQTKDDEGTIKTLEESFRPDPSAPTISGKPPAGPCESGAEYKQFDFWLGDWEARAAGDEKGALMGLSKIEKLSGGCVLQENWESPGFTGKSWNFYDAGLKQWRQIWIDVTGRKAEFIGRYHEDAMRFEGETLRADGVRFKSRMTFFNLGPDKVRQLAERSTDDGRTWTTTVDYLYLRKK